MIDFKVLIKCWTYNHKAYIEDAMDGFCKQKTSFPFLCCIVDDASVDGEQDVIRNYLNDHFDLTDTDNVRKEETDDYVMVLARHRDNHNCIFLVYYLKYNHYQIKKPKTQYFLEWQNQAKYLAICEGDDYWISSDKLEKQVSYMECHHECVLTYSNARFVKPDKRIRWINTISCFFRVEHNNVMMAFCDNSMKVLLKNGNVIQTATVCYRNFESEWQSFNNKIPFFMMMGDKPLWLFYSSLGKFKYFRSFMAAYRILSESASHTMDYCKAMKYRDNSEMVANFFNDYFSIGIDEKELSKGYRISKCRKIARFSKEDFVNSWRQLLKDYPFQLFNFRLNVIAFIRIILNKKI